MIIANGFIRFIIQEGGGIDPGTGYAIAGTETIGPPIPVQYYAKNLNFLSKDNGEPVIKQAYEILIENRYAVRSERLRLSDANDVPIGTYSLISDIPLDAVCQRKLVV